MASTVAERAKNGQFLTGTSGNPAGRPAGSKNVITAQKMIVEEAFRDAKSGDIGKVLALVVKQALEGDKASQKLIWDAAVSKQTLSEDKAVGTKQEIKVHTMNVTRGELIEGEIIDDNDNGDSNE
jgi:hypothetical protein